jgi:DNA replication protein DnaC
LSHLLLLNLFSRDGAVRMQATLLVTTSALAQNLRESRQLSNITALSVTVFSQYDKVEVLVIDKSHL